MPVVHATTVDLIGDDETDGFLSQAYVELIDPDDIPRQLRRASSMVDRAVRQPYDLNPQGAALDTDIAAALRDATCAQVEQWIEVGEENAVDGLAGSPRSVGGGMRAPSLAPRAAEILLLAGLVQPARRDQVVVL
jgi:hypothetical protein